MLELLPNRAFFRFEVPLHTLDRAPRVDANISKWGRRYLLPPLVQIEGQKPVADVYCAWNDAGLYVAFDVPDRPGQPHCNPVKWWEEDGLRFCIDTRDARDVKRGTRFCHFFYLLPLGGGRDKRGPIVGTHRMSRAKEHPPAVDESLIKVAAHVTARGYTLEAVFPAEVLNGWDPAEHPRIGLFYKVRDTRLGNQTLTTGDDLGWNVDPSTWATAVLTR